MRVNGNVLIGFLSVLGMIGGGWLATNYVPRTIGVIFTLLSVLGLLVSALAGPISRFFGRSISTSGASLPLSQIGKQLAVGGILAFVPLVLSMAFGLSIGVPQVTLTVFADTIITVFLAPLVEEVFFLFAVPFLIGLLFVRYGFFGFLLTALLSSFVFSSYHWLAYGATFLVGGAFIGAFVFRLLTIILVRVWGKQNLFTPSAAAMGLVAAMVMHFVFNAWVVGRSLLIIPMGVGG